MCDPIWKDSRDREVAAEQVLLINLDDVEDGIKELERAARLGLAGERQFSHAPARAIRPRSASADDDGRGVP